ncbi:MAG: hypothetical protein ACTSR0_03415 [Candidatus Asgardarchaeia archaeon]
MEAVKLLRDGFPYGFVSFLDVVIEYHLMCIEDSSIPILELGKTISLRDLSKEEIIFYTGKSKIRNLGLDPSPLINLIKFIL